jgi:hypothetical protein
MCSSFVVMGLPEGKPWKSPDPAAKAGGRLSLGYRISEVLENR